MTGRHSRQLCPKESCISRDCKRRCFREELQRRKLQTTLETFRQDVDNISLVCFDLEHKVDSLQEEVDFGENCAVMKA